MGTPKELSDLIRSIARSDWEQIDRLLDQLRETGWAGSAQVLGAAFALSVHRRFGSNYDPREITRFVQEIRSRYENAADLPALEMEGFIRAALGETELMDSITAEFALSAQIVILGTLLQDDNLTESELEEFITEVETTAARFI